MGVLAGRNLVTVTGPLAVEIPVAGTSAPVAAGPWSRGASVGMGLLRRFAVVLATLLVTSLVLVMALAVAPGTALSFLAGGQTLTPERAAQLTEQYALDQPWPLRWWSWLTAALHGDFGTSLFYQAPVLDLVRARVGETLALVGYASLLTVLIGVGVGIVGALRGGWVGSITSAATTVAIAVPPFVVAILLLTAFAVELPWFPALGSGEGFWDRLHHLTLPALALALGAATAIARVTREAVRSEVGKEHVATAELRGIPRSRVVRRHVLRNALTPVLTVSGLTVAGMMSGAVVIESAFGLDGIGTLLLQAIGQKDFAVVQLVVPLLVLVFLVVNTVIDVVCQLIDPRLRAEGAR